MALSSLLLEIKNLASTFGVSKLVGLSTAVALNSAVMVNVELTTPEIEVQVKKHVQECLQSSSCNQGMQKTLESQNNDSLFEKFSASTSAELLELVNSPVESELVNTNNFDDVLHYTNVYIASKGLRVDAIVSREELVAPSRGLASVASQAQNSSAAVVASVASGSGKKSDGGHSTKSTAPSDSVSSRSSDSAGDSSASGSRRSNNRYSRQTSSGSGNVGGQDFSSSSSSLNKNRPGKSEKKSDNDNSNVSSGQGVTQIGNGKTKVLGKNKNKETTEVSSSSSSSSSNSNSSSSSSSNNSINNNSNSNQNVSEFPFSSDVKSTFDGSNSIELLTNTTSTVDSFSAYIVFTSHYVHLAGGADNTEALLAMTGNRKLEIEYSTSKGQSVQVLRFTGNVAKGGNIKDIGKGVGIVETGVINLDFSQLHVVHISYEKNALVGISLDGAMIDMKNASNVPLSMNNLLMGPGLDGIVYEVFLDDKPSLDSNGRLSSSATNRIDALKAKWSIP